MYSAVLMLALTAGAENVEFGNRGGCTGTVASGCTGSRGGCKGVVVGSCHGRRGGCSGTVVHSGCRGTVVHSGCRGTVVHSGCRGTVVHSGCRGTVVTGSCTGSHGCRGGGLFSCLRNHGCSGGCVGTVAPATKPAAKPAETVAPPEKKKVSLGFSPATIVVNLPTDARLTIDGVQTFSTADRRSFVTPALQVGSTYGYTLRAEVVSNGQTVVQTQEVTVRGGETSTVQFNFAAQTVASR